MTRLAESNPSNKRRQARCFYCKRFVYSGELWCRDCAPETPCRDFPPRCAPYSNGACCMEEEAAERIRLAESNPSKRPVGDVPVENIDAALRWRAEHPERHPPPPPKKRLPESNPSKRPKA